MIFNRHKKRTFLFDGGVVKISLLQPRAKFTGRAKAFLVEDGVFYNVTDLGGKAPALS